MAFTLAVHGTISPAGLTLRFPCGTATDLDFLGWQLPPAWFWPPAAQDRRARSAGGSTS
jgi:hypothetical protein